MKKIIKRFLPDFLVRIMSRNLIVQRLYHLLRHHLFLRATLVRQLSSNSKGEGGVSKTKGKRVLVPLIETSHYQYLQILIVAKALQLRGAEVKVLICGQSLDGCELKSSRNEHDNDPCWKCRFNERNVLPLFGLEIVRIKDVLTVEEVQALGEDAKQVVSSDVIEITRHGVNLFQCIEDSVVRYFYGGAPLDSETVKEIRREHTKTALMSIEVAKRIDDVWTPDIVFNNMGCYSAWEPFFRFYKKNGNRFVTMSITPFDYGCIRFNLPDLFQSSQRFDSYKKSRQHAILSAKERTELQKFLRQRTAGEAQIFKDMGAFAELPVGDDVLKAKLKYNTEKKNIFLFTNIYWDVGISDNGGVYPDVITWALDTVELCSQYDNCHLYIKPHPAEVFGVKSSKGLSQFIKDKYSALPKNVTIIEPEWKIKPYDLFPFIDVGVIFTGTLGLEMMLADIPVISTGLTSHKGLGLAIEPESTVAYLAAMLSESKPPAIDRDQLELFAYFYFIRTLIPWNLTKQAFADDFDGFAFKSLDDLMPGKNPSLDHICDCIFDMDNAVPEAWVDM